MKKITMAAALAFAALTFTGCNNNSAPKADLKNALDSLSYMYGLGQGNSYSQQLASAGIDSTNIDQFIKGVMEGVKASDDKNKEAYFFGMSLGMQCAKNMVPNINYRTFGEDSTKTISVENLVAGLVKGLKEKNPEMTFEQINNIIMEKDSIVKEEIFGDVKKANKDFLVENAKKEGVKTTESGLQYKVIEEGKGAVPAADATVNIKFVGKLIDGTEFDSSRGEAIPMNLNRSIAGFKEALSMMPIGSKWQLFVPAELAYGSGSAGNIKPFSTLIFDVELVSVKENKK